MGLQLNDMFAMAPQLILVTGGLSVLVAQMLVRTRRAAMAWQLSLITLVSAAVVVVFGLSDANGVVTVLPRAFQGVDTVSAVSGTFRYSTFSGNAVLLFVALALGTLLLMRRSLAAAEIDFAENYFLLLMSVAGYSYAVCAEDLVTLFVAIELGSLPMLVLVGMNRNDASANEAALKYLLLSAFAIAFLLLGISLLYGSNGTVKLKELKELGPHFLKTRVVTLGYAFVFVGFLFKIAAFPMHAYVADVYEGAATMFTGLLASLSKAASVLLLLKISLGIHDGYRQYFAPLLTVLAIASMFYGAFASLATQNLKRILAYSSIGHAGYLLCFLVVPASTDIGIVGMLKQDAGSAVYLYMVGYAFSALLAFGSIAYLEISRGSREVITLASLTNLSGRDKLAAWSLALGVLSFMGMPPLAGFFGKYHLFRYLALSNNLMLAAAAAGASAVAVYAYIRVLKPIFFADAESAATDKNPVFPVTYSVRFAVAFMIVLIGFFAAFSGFLYNSGILAIHKIY
ncbi:MAG: NADH-quinone oxidoreductase subunit N [Turneriella sp.]